MYYTASRSRCMRLSSVEAVIIFSSSITTTTTTTTTTPASADNQTALQVRSLRTMYTQLLDSVRSVMTF